MKSMKKLLCAAGIAASLAAAGAQAATYVYVGKWHVGDGPTWTTNPDVLSGVEAAALLFGGNAGDYAISTVSDQVADINFKSFLDGWGDSTYLFQAQPQDWKVDSGAPGYNDPYGGPSYSAYVHDHSCENRYYDANAVCDESEPGVNYAFRVEGAEVPVPGTLTLLGVGLAGLGLVRRKRAA